MRDEGDIYKGRDTIEATDNNKVVPEFDFSQLSAEVLAHYGIDPEDPSVADYASILSFASVQPTVSGFLIAKVEPSIQLPILETTVLYNPDDNKRRMIRLQEDLREIDDGFSDALLSRKEPIKAHLFQRSSPLSVIEYARVLKASPDYFEPRRIIGMFTSTRPQNSK